MKKKSIKKLALNKERISEISYNNLREIKAGKLPETYWKICNKDTNDPCTDSYNHIGTFE